MRAECRFVAVLAAAVLAAWGAQSRTSVRGPHRMEIKLERLENGAWKLIDPGLVLATDDRVRFRFRANFAGYLYVTNNSTSGNQTLLFPREDTGLQNRMEAGKEYTVPATEGAFRILGPPGYDVVSWLVSPVTLGRPAAPAPHTRPPATLLPRCDDAILKARGDCVDRAAGPRQQSRGLEGELVIIREKNSSVVSAPEPPKGPIVYEFRLAHK
ncbi:MAG: DUF4384 domain-containing protein [Acidobacteria bacterium]|nr:DUF4384 domain-containing protein [Acidobacteriota bacterium]MBI3282038.1 DUF4384 domain-containing protein [Acidobacteriota bacterium]